MHSVENLIQKGIIDGAVVLAGTPEKELFSHVSGTADRNTGRKMTRDTIFDIASVTKAAGTNTSLLLCMEDGKIDPDAPFTEYLKGYHGKLIESVTIRQLSTHHSGINIQYAHCRDDKKMTEGLLSTDFLYPPMTRFEYTCTNYIFLGLIIEAVTGKLLSEFAQERIFTPLKMKNTRWGEPVAGGVSRTIRTINADPGVISDYGAQEYHPHPAGNAGIFSTADDLAKLCSSLLTGGKGLFRHPETANDCFDFCVTPGNGIRPHAFGWDKEPSFLPKGCSPETVYHSGWTGQTVWMDPVKQRYIIVLTNRFGDWQEAKNGRKHIAEEVLKTLSK